MSSNTLRTRRATAEDFPAILEMSSGLFGGVDYISAHYFVYLQDPRCYCYVAEVDGQVISYEVIRIMEDEKRLYGLAGRTHPGFRKSGANKAITEACLLEIKSDHPLVAELQGISIDSPMFQEALQKKPDLHHIYDQWRYNIYTIKGDAIKSLHHRLTAHGREKGKELTQLLSYHQAMEQIEDIHGLLLSLGVGYIFTRRFSDFPYKVSFPALRECFMLNEVITTTNKDKKISAVSYYASLSNSTKGSITIVTFEGKDMGHFKQHIQLLLSHVLSKPGNRQGETVSFIINFPCCLAEEAVEQYLSGLLGVRIQINGGLTSVYLKTRSLL